LIVNVLLTELQQYLLTNMSNNQKRVT